MITKIRTNPPQIRGSGNPYHPPGIMEKRGVEVHVSGKFNTIEIYSHDECVTYKVAKRESGGFEFVEIGREKAYR